MGNVLMRLGNHIKNQLTEEKGDNFHEQYCALIEKSDTSDVWRQFVIWILVDEEYGVIRFADSSGGSERRSGSERKRTIQHVADLYIQKCEDVERWHAANTNAYIEAANSFRDTPAAKASNAAWAAANYMWCEYEPGYNDYAPISVVINAAKCYALTHPAYGCVHYGRMANKLIELLQAAPEKIMVGTIDDASMYNAADPIMWNKLLIDLGMRIKENILEEQAERFDDKYFLRMPYRDTSDVWRQFAIWLLVDEEHGVLRFTNPNSLQYKAIQRVADLYIEDCKDADAWKEAAEAAWSAYAPWYHSEDEAARAACYAAYAAYAAAANRASDAALAADTAATKAGFFVHYGRMANKLIELLNAAPLMENVATCRALPAYASTKAFRQYAESNSQGAYIMDDEVKCNEVYNCLRLSLDPEMKRHAEFEDEVLREVKKSIQNKQNKHIDKKMNEAWIMAHQILIRIGMHIEKKLGEEKTKDFMAKYYYLLHERDTSDVWRQFALWLLLDAEYGVFRFTKPDSKQRKAIIQVADLYIEHCKDSLRWKDAFVAAETAIGCGFFDQGVSNKEREATATATRVAFNAVAVWYDPFSAIEAVSNSGYVFFLSGRSLVVYYERMANVLIELLQNTPMIHEAQCNEQESMVDNIDNAVRPVMDNSDKMKFLIFYQDSVKTLMESIEKHVNLLKDELSVVKELFKNNPSDDISVN